jgi:hypothetical protein
MCTLPFVTRGTTTTRGTSNRLRKYTIDDVLYSGENFSFGGDFAVETENFL